MPNKIIEHQSTNFENYHMIEVKANVKGSVFRMIFSSFLESINDQFIITVLKAYFLLNFIKYPIFIYCFNDKYYRSFSEPVFEPYAYRILT